MTIKLILLSIAFALWQLTNTAQAIVGGSPVYEIEEAPFIVRAASSCAGVILSDSWILTAAHCRIPAITVVFGGQSDIQHSLHGYQLGDTVYAIDHSVVHPELKKDSFLDENGEKTDILSNDIMLLRTYRKMKLTEKLQPIEIADPIDLADQTLTVYGWGATSEGSQETQTQLMKAEVPFVSLETANKPASYNGLIQDWAHIVAGVPDGSVDSCNGDSGGPIVLQTPKASLLVGIVSGGKGCGRANKYGIYANAMKMKPWIEKTMKERTFISDNGEIWLNGKNAIVVAKTTAGYRYIKMILHKSSDDLLTYKDLGTGEYAKLRRDMTTAKVRIGRENSVWLKR